MHVRLLDMGMVSVLRSQSIYHGVTSMMGADSDPAISIMRPEAPYVSIGYFQEARAEIDLAYCEQNRLPVIRRHVGGGAVLLDSNQLFFHVMLPREKAADMGLPHSLEKRFAYLAKPVILAYNKLGINASFRPVNDIHVNGRKIGGTGVGEINDGIVFAGSMMFDFDTELMARVLNLPDAKMRDKVAGTMNDYMTTMKKELGKFPKLEDVGEALLTSFEEIFHITLIPSMPTGDELDSIYHWDNTLSSDAWLNAIQHNPKPNKDVKISASVRVLQAAHKAPGGLIRATVRTIDDVIDQMQISGDFPMSPQEGLFKLTRKFCGVKLDKTAMTQCLERSLDEMDIDLAGVDSDDFGQLFEQIIQ